MKALSIILMSFFMALGAVPSLTAQDTQPVAKQELARTKFKDLHERMQKLQAILARTDPDESKILQVGNRYVQEAQIHEDMAAIQKLLDQKRWDEALEEMRNVRGELNKLLELLMNREMDLAKLMAEIERLEAFKKRVEGLIEEQHKEKEDSARTEALQKQLQAIEDAKKEVERLLAEQKSLRAETNAAGMAAAPEAAQKMAGEQGELKDAAKGLAEELAKLEKKQEELKKDGSPGEPKDGDQGGSGSGSGSCSSCAGGASQAMGKSQEKLGQNKPESSLKDQDQAIEKLQKAIEELEEMAEEARRELLKLPFEQQYRAQEQTKMDTDTLAKDMEKSEQPGEDGEAPKPTPGRKNVQQAVPKQKAAAGMLKEKVPAKQKQQDAKEDLENARDELEEALAQLRQQLQDEVLRALEERFAAMLAKQKELSAVTKVVDRTRGEVLTADGSLPAALQEKCADIAAGEIELGVEASDALKLLEEEGTTAVFPDIVAVLRDDLYAVGKIVKKNETGRNVQRRQADIEDTLRMLINALRRKIEENMGQPGQCNGQPPLVPISAELKMLRFLQERVNKNTAAYDSEVPEALRGTEEATDEAQAISDKQGRVRDLTRKLAVKLNKENQADTGGGR